MGYKISALESRDKKKLTSADLNFFKGQQCLTFLAISKDRSRRSGKEDKTISEKRQNKIY